jgi:hypothetical protein
MTYEIREATNSDTANIISFNPIKSEELYYEFFHRDISVNSCLFVVEDTNTNEIIGTQGYIAYPMYKDGVEVLTTRSERTLVDNRLRGGGWFNKLVLSCDNCSKIETSEITWGNTSALKAFSKAGFEIYSGFRTYCVLSYSNGVFATLDAISGIFSLNNLKKILTASTKREKTLSDAKFIMSYLASVMSIFRLRGIEKPIKECFILDCHEFGSVALDRINKINIQRSLKDKSYYIKYTDWLAGYLIERYKHEKQVYILRNNERDLAYFIIGENRVENLLEVIDFGVEDAIYFDIGLRLIDNKKYKDKSAIFWVALNIQSEIQMKAFEAIRKMLLIRKSALGSFVIKAETNNFQISQAHITDVWNVI